MITCMHAHDQEHACLAARGAYKNECTWIAPDSTMILGMTRIHDDFRLRKCARAERSLDGDTMFCASALVGGGFAGRSSCD